MRRSVYICYGVIFFLLLVLTVFKINTSIVKNQQSIVEYFLDVDPAIVTPDEPENPELVPYADSSDLYTLQHTQTIRLMLQAMRISNLDIISIEKLTNIDSVLIQKGSNVRMTYINDIDNLQNVTTFPPYISDKDLVRNIKLLY